MIELAYRFRDRSEWVRLVAAAATLVANGLSKSEEEVDNGKPLDLEENISHSGFNSLSEKEKDPKVDDHATNESKCDHNYKYYSIT